MPESDKQTASIVAALANVDEATSLKQIYDVVKFIAPIIGEIETAAQTASTSQDVVAVALQKFLEALSCRDSDPQQTDFFVAGWLFRLLKCRISDQSRSQFQQLIDRNLKRLWGTGTRDLDTDEAFDCWFATARQRPDVVWTILHPFHKEDGEGTFFLVPRSRAGMLLHKKSRLNVAEAAELVELQSQDIADIEADYQSNKERLTQTQAAEQLSVKQNVELLSAELTTINRNQNNIELEAAWQRIAAKQKNSLTRLEDWFNSVTAKINKEFKTAEDDLVNNQVKQYDLHQARVRHEDAQLISKIAEIQDAYANQIREIEGNSITARLVHRTEHQEKKHDTREQSVAAVNQARRRSVEKQLRIESDIETLAQKTQQRRDRAEATKKRQTDGVRAEKRKKLTAINQAFDQQREPYAADISRLEATRSDLDGQISALFESLTSQPAEMQQLEREFAAQVAARRPQKREVTWEDFPAYQGFLADGWLPGKAPRPETRD